MAKIKHEVDWRAKRKAAYPPLADLADALYHQAAGRRAPMDAYVAAVADVKRRIPKPEQGE